MSNPSQESGQQSHQNHQEDPSAAIATMADVLPQVMVPIPDPSGIFYNPPDTWTIPPATGSDPMLSAANFSQFLDAGSFKPPIGVNYPESSSTDDTTYVGTSEDWSQSLSPESSASSAAMMYSTQPSPHFGRMMPPGTIPRDMIQTVEEHRRSKRRAQNRAAQHAFKDRKRAHEKELCEEIKAIERDNAQLRGQNAQLKRVLESRMTAAASMSGQALQQQGQSQVPASSRPPQRSQGNGKQRAQVTHSAQTLQLQQYSDDPTPDGNRRKSSSAAASIVSGASVPSISSSSELPLLTTQATISSINIDVAAPPSATITTSLAVQVIDMLSGKSGEQVLSASPETGKAVMASLSAIAGRPEPGQPDNSGVEKGGSS